MNGVKVVERYRLPVTRYTSPGGMTKRVPLCRDQSRQGLAACENLKPNEETTPQSGVSLPGASLER